MKKIIIIAACFLLACSFSGKKPLKIQEWQLDTYKTNEAGEVTYVHYNKVGAPQPMHDTDLRKTVYSIIQH